MAAQAQGPHRLSHPLPGVSARAIPPVCGVGVVTGEEGEWARRAGAGLSGLGSRPATRPPGPAQGGGGERPEAPVWPPSAWGCRAGQKQTRSRRLSRYGTVSSCAHKTSSVTASCPATEASPIAVGGGEGLWGDRRVASAPPCLPFHAHVCGALFQHRGAC